MNGRQDDLQTIFELLRCKLKKNKIQFSVDVYLALLHGALGTGHKSTASKAELSANLQNTFCSSCIAD